MRKKKSTSSSRQDEQHRDINRGAWTPEEDARLAEFIRTHQKFCWRSLPKKAGLNRCGKSCRLRWMNYLRPDIKRGNISKDEEELIIRMHRLLGNRWSLIAGRLPGRTDNEIKNYWNTHLSKKVSLVSSSTTSSYSSIICEKKQISLPCVTSDAPKNDDQSSGSLLQVSSSKKEELLHGGSEESNNSEIAAHDLFIMDKAAALYDEQHGLLLDFDSQEDYFFMQSMLQTAVDNDDTEKQKHDYNEHTVGWVPVDGILGQWMHMNYSN